MKVKDFFDVTKGSRQLVVSGSGEAPMCDRDFWGKYRSTDVWEAEVDHVSLVPRKVEQDGLWFNGLRFDGVICEITLKRKNAGGGGPAPGSYSRKEGIRNEND